MYFLVIRYAISFRLAKADFSSSYSAYIYITVLHTFVTICAFPAAVFLVCLIVHLIVSFIMQRTNIIININILNVTTALAEITVMDSA